MILHLYAFLIFWTNSHWGCLLDRTQAFIRQGCQINFNYVERVFFLLDKKYLLGSGCLLGHLSFMLYFLGEKMTEEEVNLLVSGIEDQQGQINYEGIIM